MCVIVKLSVFVDIHICPGSYSSGSYSSGSYSSGSYSSGSYSSGSHSSGSLVPGTEEERLVHTNALQVN